MRSIRAWLVAGVLSMGAAHALAQTAPPASVAQNVGEAPGAHPLAPLPPEEDPAHARSMAFAPGGSQCRETVPGGTLLAVAYAIVLVALGVYVALLARKNAQLTASLADLERTVARRRGRVEDPDGGADA